MVRFTNFFLSLPSNFKLFIMEKIMLEKNAKYTVADITLADWGRKEIEIA